MGNEELLGVWGWSGAGVGQYGMRVFGMGTLRWDGRDARFCIENRFTVFAGLCRVRI